MDVGVWLRALGLGQYEEKFRDNKIDADVLPRLTADDLKDVGVAAVGDRRRLLDAIAALAAAKPADASPFAHKSVPLRSDQLVAERRPITVMFCDLVGSTSLAAKLDAEDWRNLINAYLYEASTAVIGLGGHVQKKLGDGLMALFGYPQAQENDAERAVRAALAIQRALADLNARNARSGAPELSARVGIESGPVIVDAVGEVFGEAPNVAARVQAAAEPGAVIVTATVQRQVAGLFVAEDKGAHTLKGVPQPMTLYRIVRASGGGRRGGARALSPFVGRQEELALLMRRWDCARSGEGQFLQIAGEPGLGKSRLMDEFHARIGETPHTWAEWASSQLLQNTPLHPIAEWGRIRFGGAEVALESRLDLLEGAIRQVGLDAAEFAPLLAPLLEIPLPQDSAPKLAPEEFRRRQLAALVAWILAAARTQPIVLAFEDLHWADPTSLDLMKTLAERGATAPLLIVATMRPEFRAPWTTRSHHGVMSLVPLDRAQIREMVEAIAERHALSQEVVKSITDRTGGVPLFVEEVTRLLLERGEQGGAQAIPPTLQQSLAARLDRLGQSREVAQIGAVLGREFAYPVLRDVAKIDEPALQAALERLAEADIVFVDGVVPRATYRFKHALVQDAAYDSLLKSRRQALHRRAAELLCDNPERAAAEPEAIAHHFTEAGLEDPAIQWWGKAGDQALRRSAFSEAITHLGRAIAMADKVAGMAPRPGAGEAAAASQRLKLQTDYGQAVMWSKGFAADETKTAFARAGEFAGPAGDAPARLVAYYAQCLRGMVRGEYGQARDIAETFLRVAEAEGRATEAAAARRMLGLVLLNQGELKAARSVLERALSDTAFQRDGETQFLFDWDTDGEASAAAYLALAEWHLGELGRARQLIDQAIRRTDELGHVATVANVLFFKTVLESRRDDASATQRAAKALLRLTEEHGIKSFADMVQAYVNWTHGRLVDPEAGAAALGQALAAHVADGNKGAALSYSVLLAELEATTRHPDNALTLIGEALAIAEEIGGHVFDSYLHRLSGDILLRRDSANSAPAEEAYQTAVTIAKQQGARSYELLASLSLAKHYQSTARPVEAHAVLAPALEGFSPTPEMPEIAEAQALLAALVETDEVTAEAARRRRQLHLQTAYSQAMMWSKGFAAEETRAAFARSRELAGGTESPAERFPTYYAQWVRSVARGEHRQAQRTAESFLREAEEGGYATEAGVARRCLGASCFYQGKLLEARTHLEGALVDYRPDRDAQARFHFGYDTGILATANLVTTTWCQGQVERARQLAEQAVHSATELGHVPTGAFAHAFKTGLEIVRDDPVAALRSAETLLALVREHKMEFFIAVGEAYAGWARGRLDDPETGAEVIRRALAEHFNEANRINAPLFRGLLAELEAATRGPDAALTQIGKGLATAEETGEHYTDPYLHRLRGEFLLKRDPPNPVRAEEAFQTAIAIAKEQGGCSYELLASLSLARLYQSTGRPADAHAVLAPALEGFVQTSEMPEIAEAQALLAELAEKQEVKAATASRKRRLQLQANYGLALTYSRGVAAEETKAAATRTERLAAEVSDSAARFAVYYGQWLASLIGGQMGSARATAETYLREARKVGDLPDIASASRMLGHVRMMQGAFTEARVHLEEALRLYNPAWGIEVTRSQTTDWEITARVLLGVVSWQLGEVKRAGELIEQAKKRADESQHRVTLANAYMFATMFEVFRGEAEATLRGSETLDEIATTIHVRLYSGSAEIYRGWARARLGDREVGLDEIHRGLNKLAEQKALVSVQFGQGLLAELEAQSPTVDRALTRVDEALALAEQTEQHWTDSFLHRIRGNILLKAAPESPAPAEDAYCAAIAIAKEQRARSFGLQAALSLAKLYQSTGRLSDAYTVLAPALEGFTPTREMPEIAEAERLLAEVAQ